MRFSSSKKSLPRLAKVSDKKKLRSEMKAKLSLISEADIIERSSLVSKNLLELFSRLNIIHQKICIGAFAAFAKEPAMELLQKEEIEKLTSYPAFDPGALKMTFKSSRLRDLEMKADFGPKMLGPKDNASEVDPGVILIPGIAFGHQGARLGRGKGFYDRYLSHYRGIKIGICFSDQLIETVPSEEHDIPMDFIVTDKEIIKCMRA